MTKVQGRPRGYIYEYNPRTKTRVLLEQVQAVLVEYAEYLPLTLRQVFYRLVGTYDFAKDERAYARLTEHVNKARRAGWISWDAIRDDRGVISRPYGHFRDAAHALSTLRTTAQHFTLDVSVGQDVRIVVWCEAAGMVPQLERIAHRYSIEVRSGGGFDSTTRRHEVAEEIADAGHDTVLIHLGDYDPSGEAAYTAMHEDIAGYLEEDAPQIEIYPVRLVLTGEQVETLGLITAPPKPTDSRTLNWQLEKRAQDLPDETVQLEALAPDQIAALLTAAIEDQLEMDLVRQRWEQTQVFRGEILMRLDGHSSRGRD